MLSRVKFAASIYKIFQNIWVRRRTHKKQTIFNLQRPNEGASKELSVEKQLPIILKEELFKLDGMLEW